MYLCTPVWRIVMNEENIVSIERLHKGPRMSPVVTHPPARACVESRLAAPGYTVEIQVTAVA